MLDNMVRSSVTIGPFLNLKRLEISVCCISVKRSSQGCVTECDLLPNLESLGFYHLTELESISDFSNFLGLRFTKLRSITVFGCNHLENLFTMDGTLHKLAKLESIEIVRYKKLSEVFKNTSTNNFVPMLKSLTLDTLPALEEICKADESWNSLEHLQVQECSMLLKLPLSVQSAENIQSISGEQNWWNKLQWDNENLKMHLHPLFKPCIRKKKEENEKGNSDEDAKECPVCKGEVTMKNVTPIYGRGGSARETEEDSALKVPHRPQARRVESWRQTIQRAAAFTIPMEEMIRRLGSRFDLTQMQPQSLDGCWIVSHSHVQQEEKYECSIDCSGRIQNEEDEQIVVKANGLLYTMIYTNYMGRREQNPVLPSDDVVNLAGPTDSDILESLENPENRRLCDGLLRYSLRIENGKWEWGLNLIAVVMISNLIAGLWLENEIVISTTVSGPGGSSVNGSLFLPGRQCKGSNGNEMENPGGMRTPLPVWRRLVTDGHGGRAATLSQAHSNDRPHLTPLVFDVQSKQNDGEHLSSVLRRGQQRRLHSPSPSRSSARALQRSLFDAVAAPR
nr:disease resistance protein At4g27190-like [Ipomoea batatas]